MLVTWRRWFAAPAAITLAASLAACSSSSGESSESSPTLVTVAPSTFGQNLVCGHFPGAWRTYVATLTDVTDPDKPFVLPSSNPVDCTMPVSFRWVIPGHEYVAEIDAYDRADLVPAGGMSSGSRHMVDRATGTDVEPRWQTECGLATGIEDPDAGVPQDGGDAGGGSEADPTTALLQANVVIRGCSSLREVRPNGNETGIVLNLAATRGNLSCGTGADQIDRLEVIPESAVLAPAAAACDETLTFQPVDANRTYRFRVEAFESTSETARWAARCEANTKEGITLPAACDTLSNRGALRVDIGALLGSTGRSCAADDVVSYRAVLLGNAMVSTPPNCSTDAYFKSLEPASYQAVAQGYDADGAEVFAAFCEGSVQPASTVAMSCQVDVE